MTRRDFALIFSGAMFSLGICLIVLGFMYGRTFVSYIQAKYIPPVFAMPKEVKSGFAQDITNQVNIERKKANLPILHESSALSYAAYLRAQEILDSQFFSHYATGSGVVRAQQAVETVGYRYAEIGENLARGFDDPDTVVSEWLNSPKHKEVMLNGDYQEAGVSVIEGSLLQNKQNVIVLLLGKL